MEPSLLAGSKPARASDTGFDRRAAITRALLRCGVLAGPFYLAVGLAQAFIRDGFDFARHPLSLLANGQGGWIQTANFVLSGLMVLAAAVGWKRVLGRNALATCGLLGAYGAGLLVAAVFKADPVDGFPVGTPLGPPTSISTAGLVHFAAAGLGFTCFGVSAFFAARAMSRRGARAMAWLSSLAGLSVLLGFFGMFLIPALAGGTLGIWFAVVVGWAWLTVLSLHLDRASPIRKPRLPSHDPGSPP